MRFYNTLTRQKDSFTPLEQGKVGIYTCGPTVYNYAHIGNLRAFVFADILRRVLTHAGYEVRHIKNITDVGHLTADDVAQGDAGEDKIEKKARAEGKTPEEIAAFYEDYFHDAERRLNILPAQQYPRATAHIPHMVKFIAELIARGHAYATHGNVFYDVTSFPDYGRLSGNTLTQLKVGARLKTHPDKRHPWDFALWLAAPPGHLMRWPSPWGEGYPGWHIECSVMSEEYLGKEFDIHTGGEDHIFPHHEAEIAQSCGVTGVVPARLWMHGRHMLVDNEKMSKSKGNFYTLENIVEQGFAPMDLRMAFLLAHYRSPMNFTWEMLAQARSIRAYLNKTRGRVHSALASGTAAPFAAAKTHSDRLFTALEDDLNTPEALAVVQEFAREVNTTLDTGGPVGPATLHLFDATNSVLGLTPEEETPLPKNVQRLLNERTAARSTKDFARADALRVEISALGYTVEDTPEGQKAAKKQTGV